MGDLIQFRPRAAPRRDHDAIAIGCIPAGARIVSVSDGQRSTTAQSITGNGVTIFYETARDDPATGIQYAMDDDTAPGDANRDPFAEDMDHRDD